MARKRKYEPEFTYPGEQLELGVAYWDHKEQLLFMAMGTNLLVTVVDQNIQEHDFSQFTYAIEKMNEPTVGIVTALWNVSIPFIDNLSHIYLKPEMFRDTTKRVQNDSPPRDADAEYALFEDLRKFRCYMELNE